MHLTSEYRTLWATFDTPVDYLHKPIQVSPNTYRAHFKVGPLAYVLTIKRKLPPGKSDIHYTIIFEYKDVVVPEGETLATVLSELYGKPLTDDGAWALYNKMASESTGVLGVKTGFRVFSAVIKLLREYLGDKQWDCLEFSSYPESRTDLYRYLVQKFFPGHQVNERSLEYAACPR